MNSEKWFRVSLWISGDALPIEELDELLCLEADYIGRKGEHINGNEKYAKYETNVWTMSWTDDTLIPFEQQIGDLLDELEKVHLKLEELLAIPGNQANLFLGFSSANGQGGANFSPFLLKRLSRLGIAISLDLYPDRVQEDGRDGVRLPGDLDASLDDFIRTGHLGPLRLGIARQKVKRLLGSPPQWFSDSKDYEQSAIWKFGPLSLYFTKDTLYGIQIDEYVWPVWPFNGMLAHCITVSQMERQLSAAKISFKTEPFPYVDNGFRITVENGVTLTFSSEVEECIEPHLCDLAKWDHSLTL